MTSIVRLFKVKSKQILTHTGSKFVGNCLSKIDCKSVLTWASLSMPGIPVSSMYPWPPKHSRPSLITAMALLAVYILATGVRSLSSSRSSSSMTPASSLPSLEARSRNKAVQPLTSTWSLNFLLIRSQFSTRDCYDTSILAMVWTCNGRLEIKFPNAVLRVP